MTSSLELSSVDPAFDEVLTALVSKPEWEHQWLNLLSQLEFVGCRKIIKSVPFERVDLEVLRHIAEEASHAYLLKTLVPDGSAWSASPLGRIGWEYFQTLDQEVSALASDREVHYPAVSWAIERRVLWVYPLYAERTRESRVRSVVRGILSQEQRHGEQFDEVAFPDSFREAVIQIEERLWNTFRDRLHSYFREAHSACQRSSVA
jgi:hypothetical protein